MCFLILLCFSCYFWSNLKVIANTEFLSPVYSAYSLCTCVYPNPTYSFSFSCSPSRWLLCTAVVSFVYFCVIYSYNCRNDVCPPHHLPLPANEVLFHWCAYCKVFPLPPLLTTSTWPITDDSLYTQTEQSTNSHHRVIAALRSVSLLPLHLVFHFIPPSLSLFLCQCVSVTCTRNACTQSEQDASVIFENEMETGTN